MVKIRLSQTGTTNRKTYRLVAIDESKRRDGRAIEILGSYDPLVRPPKFVVKMDRVNYWTGVGAQVSKSAAKLLNSQK